MGRMKEKLKYWGYDAKERAYIYGGAIAGAIAPIVGARYLLFEGIKSDNLVGEAIAWGGALLVNASTMIFSPYLPAPVYTALAGTAIGTLAAKGSQRKRQRETRSLEDITKEAPK